jgi:hypothetical protein
MREVLRRFFFLIFLYGVVESVGSMNVGCDVLGIIFLKVQEDY